MSKENVKVTDIKHLGKLGKKAMNAALKFKDTFTKARDKYGVKIVQFITACEIDGVWMRQETAAELLGCDRSYISKLKTAVLIAIDKKATDMVHAHELVEKLGVVKFLDKYSKPKVVADKDKSAEAGDETSDGETIEGESETPTLPTTGEFMTQTRAFIQALESGVAVPTPEQAETLAIQLMEIVDSIAEHSQQVESEQPQQAVQ